MRDFVLDLGCRSRTGNLAYTNSDGSMEFRLDDSKVSTRTVCFAQSCGRLRTGKRLADDLNRPASDFGR